MSTAVIGDTGFVGGNLLAQTAFDDRYNSRNIENIQDREYDLIVCAGARAEKWRINQAPDEDWGNIQRLIRCLGRTRTRRLVLISTVDVYPQSVNVDEDSTIDPDLLAPYGKHRRRLEMELARRFDTTVIRLPGLFGTGLKKNVIYDLLHDNLVDRIHCEAVFQFYNLAHLWNDIQTALAAGLAVVNFATQPTSVREITREAFGIVFDNVTDAVPAHYDFRTKHAATFGGRDGYLYDKTQVVAELRDYVRSQREGRA